MKRLLLTLLLLLLIHETSSAGGPLGSTGTVARRYAQTSFPLRFMVDQGALGAFTNATGVTITNYAFTQWANVKSATLSFTNAGYLPRDVTSATDPYISGSTQWSDGVNPVIFDATGAITDAKLGTGAHNSVLGFAGSAYSGNTYVEGYAIINGALSGSGTATDVDRYEAVLTHEIGHFLGLGHSQVSMHGDFCTMYPVIQKTTQKTLQPDDTTAIANLYPTAAFLAATGSISGTVRTPAGGNLSGLNVIAENTATGASYSTVVDYFSGGKSGYDAPPVATGTYTFTGLRPGSYYIRIEPINATFSGGSSVASYYTPINVSVFREWWNDGSESGDMLTDNVNLHTAVNVTAGLTTTGVNFVSNESSTLATLTYHNGTPYYIWTLPQSNIVKYAIRNTAPFKGTLTQVQFRLDPSSVLPIGGTMTISVHQNAAGSLAGIPGAIIGSVTIPYSELAADQYNEIYLKDIGAGMTFDSLATFHVSFSTNGIGSPVFYTDNGSPSQNRTSYQTSDGVWRNFPDGGWAAGYNLIASTIFSRAPVVVPVVTRPVVALSPTSINFGSVNLHVALDKIVRVANTGNAPLVVNGTSIQGIDSLDYTIVVGAGGFTLAPGAYRDITIRFQPCPTAGAEGPTRSAKLVIVSNAGTSPDYVPLVGTAVTATPLAVLTPIRLGPVRPGSRILLDTGIIYNAGTDTLRASSMSILGMGSDATTLRFLTPAGAQDIAPDSTLGVQLEFNPSTRGSYEATLRLYHDEMPGYTDIPIYANSSAGDLVSQRTLSITSPVSLLDSTLILRNTGNAPLLIRGLTISSYKDTLQGAFFRIQQMLPIEIAEGDSIRLPILFTPTAGKGNYHGSLAIESNGFPDTVWYVALSASTGQLAVTEADPSAPHILLTPNPVANDLNVVLSNLERGHVTIHDVQGSVRVIADVDRSNSSIDVRNLPSGEYYLTFEASGTRILRKFVVVR